MDDEFMQMFQALRDEIMGPLRVFRCVGVTTTMIRFPQQRNEKNGVQTLGQTDGVLIHARQL